MSAGPEHDHDQTQPEKTRPRSAWLGSRRLAVLAGVVAAGLLAGAGVALAATSSPGHSASPGEATAATPSPSASPAPPFHRLPFRLGPLFGGALPFGGPLGP